MPPGSSIKALYLQELKQAPVVVALIGDGSLVGGESKPTVMSASDYSYSATSYAGPNYRIVGDAAGICI